MAFHERLALFLVVLIISIPSVAAASVNDLSRELDSANGTETRLEIVRKIEAEVRAEEPFSEKETKILALIDDSPRPHRAIVDALSKLHGDADIEFLVRQYASNSGINATFRASLVSELYQQTRNGSNLRPDTVEVLQELGESADNYFTVRTVIQIFESIDRPVSWAIRIKSMKFQWSVLFVLFILSWIIAIAGGIAWLIQIALPSKSTLMSPRSRIGGLLGWLAMAAAFLALNVAAIVHSLGHNSSPPPGPAAPFYLLMLFLACIIAVVSILMWRKRSTA